MDTKSDERAMNDMEVAPTVTKEIDSTNDKIENTCVENSEEITNTAVLTNGSDKKPVKARKTPLKSQTPLQTLTRAKTLKTPTASSKKRETSTSISSKKKLKRSAKKEPKLESEADEKHHSQLGLMPKEIPLRAPPENIPMNLIGRRVSLVWEMEDKRKEWWAGTVKRLKSSQKSREVVVRYEGDNGKERFTRFDAEMYSTDPDAPVGSWCTVSLPEDPLRVEAEDIEDVPVEEQEETIDKGANVAESAATKAPISGDADVGLIKSPVNMASKAVKAVTSAGKKMVCPLVSQAAAEGDKSEAPEDLTDPPDDTPLGGTDAGETVVLIQTAERTETVLQVKK